LTFFHSASTTAKAWACYYVSVLSLWTLNIIRLKVQSALHGNMKLTHRKGSRQNRSVTSGKGLALRVERLEPELRSNGPELGYCGLLSGGLRRLGSRPLWTSTGRIRATESLPQRTTNLELERTRGIRLFN
jgi:hypothetical protein